MAFAGLWDRWEGAEGQRLESCTILVGPPDAAVEGIHDRSPVLLADAAVPLWISPLLRAEDGGKVLQLEHGGLKAQKVERVVAEGLVFTQD